MLIPGKPKVGRDGRQEFPKGEAEDHFRSSISRRGSRFPMSPRGKAQRTSEWTPLEPGVIDNKYYVRGIGTVREIAVRGPVEELRLISFKRG